MLAREGQGISSFGLGTFSCEDGRAFPGLVLDDKVLDLREHFGAGSTTLAMLESWDKTLRQLRALADGPGDAWYELSRLRPLPPIQPLGQVFCAGANYRKHLVQLLMGAGRDSARSSDDLLTQAIASVEERAASEMPFVYTPPTSAVSGANDDIVLWGPGVQHDWELELAVVIGRKARDVSPEDAMTYVAGYTMSNDISTRDVMNRPNLALTDFLMTKGRPGFFPTGPYLVPAEFVPDYRDLRITLKLNDVVMQDESVDDIIYGIEELVSYTSSVSELRPGDVLLTGSPGGNAGYHGDRWLRPGDMLEGTITGLGTMRNKCVADDRSGTVG